MNELKIQSIVNAVNLQSSIGKSSSTSSFDFKSMLADEINSKQTKTYTQEEIDNFKKCEGCYGEGKHSIFPPNDAPVEFKAIWDEVCSRMNNEEFFLFTNDFIGIITDGVSPRTFNPDGDILYKSSEARINRLGYAGCVEFALKSQERFVNQNKLGGNEQRWIDVMQKTVDALKEVKSRLQELDDNTINNQIMSADIEYEFLAAKDDRDMMELTMAMESGISKEEFQDLMHKFEQRQIKLMSNMADGTILTTVMRDGQIINSFRSKPHAMDLLSIV